MKIVSLLPAASELLCDLGEIDNISAVSHECNYPELLKEKVQITSSNIPNNVEQKLIDNLVSEAIKINSHFIILIQIKLIVLIQI